MPINMFTTLDDPSATRGTFADGINAWPHTVRAQGMGARRIGVLMGLCCKNPKSWRRE
jgi:hypothetical protein